jgi:hypothetical protein
LKTSYSYTTLQAKSWLSFKLVTKLTLKSKHTDIITNAEEQPKKKQLKQWTIKRRNQSKLIIFNQNQLKPNKTDPSETKPTNCEHYCDSHNNKKNTIYSASQTNDEHWLNKQNQIKPNHMKVNQMELNQTNWNNQSNQ